MPTNMGQMGDDLRISRAKANILVRQQVLTVTLELSERDTSNSSGIHLWKLTVIWELYLGVNGSREMLRGKAGIAKIKNYGHIYYDLFVAADCGYT